MKLTVEQWHEILVESGGVTEEEFQKAIDAPEQKETGIDGYFIAHGLLKDEQIGQLVAAWSGRIFVKLDDVSIPKDVIQLLPESFAREHLVIPISVNEQEVYVATNRPEDKSILSILEKYLRKSVEFHYATRRDLLNHLYLFQGDIGDVVQKMVTETIGGETRIIRLVDTIMTAAYQGGASDVHIEPEERETVVRFRTDGVLHEVAHIPMELHESVMTRLKVLSRLATDQHQAAQDGKMLIKTPYGEEIEIRLSIVPTTHAEKAVLRILSDKNRAFTLSDIGLSTEDFKHVTNVIHEPWGMILVTGPTGSGKTTTLYSVLKILNQRDVNVTTIEDPVEYDMEGVAQIQVNEKTELTFAKGLRSVVRQDPDIIMVGEIRDTETAGISVNAAMTGHLVLSTLHTNDAATAFLRLGDMEVEEFLVASTVNVIIAQRLVRKICPSCIQSVKVSEADLMMIKQVPNVEAHLKHITGGKIGKTTSFYQGAGCHVCHGSGYRGRIGIFEILRNTEGVRQAVMNKESADEIQRIAVEEGMTTMLYDGLRKVTMGQTTLEEVLRVTR
jgi:type II secretory ATPase GspE/PulE/Tfp pilus assembly ATPase PilB-like protein